MEAIVASVSHIVSADPATSVPGYSVEKTFGTIRILRRDADESAARRWQEYAPTITDDAFTKLMRQTLSRCAHACRPIRLSALPIDNKAGLVDNSTLTET